MLALQLKGEVIGQVATLVIAAEKPQGVGVVDLEGPEVKDTLYAEVAAVHVIAEEEIPSLGGVAANLKQLHQVVVLAVDIAAHGDGRIHLEQVGLGAQDLRALLDDP